MLGHVRNVDLDGWNLHRLNCIEQRDARVGVGAWINYDAGSLIIVGFLNLVYKIALMIRLVGVELVAIFLGVIPQKLK